MFEKLNHKRFLDLENHIPTVGSLTNWFYPKEGWIQFVRMGLNITKDQLSRRLNISRSDLMALENAEADGTVTLAKLKRTAESLNCELKYTFVPKKDLRGWVAEKAEKAAMARVFDEEENTGEKLTAEQHKIHINQYAREYAQNVDSAIWDV